MFLRMVGEYGLWPNAIVLTGKELVSFADMQDEFE